MFSALDSYQIIDLTILSPVLWVAFIIFWIMSLTYKRLFFFFWMKCNLFIFDPYAFDIILKKSLLNTRSQVFATMFPNGMATHSSIENPMDRGA